MFFLGKDFCLHEKITKYLYVAHIEHNSYCSVDLYYNNETKANVVTKSYDITKQKTADNESAILKLLDHPSIPKLVDDYIIETKRNIVMDFCPGIEMGEFLYNKKDILTICEIEHIYCHLCEVLQYVHIQDIVHGDIKFENIIIDPTLLKIYLVDWGYSSLLSSKKEKIGLGTLPYLAPELLHNKHICFGNDVWSLGVCMYFTLSYDFPFGHKMEKKTEENILAYNVTYPPEFPLKFKDILQTIFVHHAQRATITNVLERLKQ
jgi:serine/threonine protein kinase